MVTSGKITNTEDLKVPYASYLRPYNANKVTYTLKNTVHVFEPLQTLMLLVYLGLVVFELKRRSHHTPGLLNVKMFLCSMLGTWSLEKREKKGKVN